MKIKKAKIGLFFIFFIGLFNLSWAIELPSISKAKIRLSITPGKSSYGEIILENPSSEKRPMRVYLEDWYYLPVADGSKEFVPANTTPLSCASWITFSPAEFTLAPFGRQRVNYLVKVPPQTKGGYYTVLFFETALGEVEAREEGVGAGINLAVRIAALFYIEVEGTINRTAVIENLTLKKDKGLLVRLDFRNTGNIDITAGGSFHIMDKDGLIYARGEFNDVYTFPGDIAKLTANWKEPLSRGKYDLVLTLNIGKALEEAGMGRGLVTVKETSIEIGKEGEVVRVGQLK